MAALHTKNFDFISLSAVIGDKIFCVHDAWFVTFYL